MPRSVQISNILAMYDKISSLSFASDDHNLSLQLKDIKRKQEKSKEDFDEAKNEKTSIETKFGC